MNYFESLILDKGLGLSNKFTFKEQCEAFAGHIFGDRELSKHC